MNLEDLSKLKYNDSNFENVLGFVSQVQKAKTDKNADITATIIGINDLRDDVVQPSLPVKVALQNAKNHDSWQFIVPLVVE